MLRNFSHIKITKILLGITTSYKLLFDDIVIDDEWSMPSTFTQQTIKQLGVIQEVVLSNVSNLNDLVMNKK